MDAFEFVVMLLRWPLVTDDVAPLSLPRLGSGHTRPYPETRAGGHATMRRRWFDANREEWRMILLGESFIASYYIYKSC